MGLHRAVVGPVLPHIDGNVDGVAVVNDRREWDRRLQVLRGAQGLKLHGRRGGVVGGRIEDDVAGGQPRLCHPVRLANARSEHSRRDVVVRLIGHLRGAVEDWVVEVHVAIARVREAQVRGVVGVDAAGRAELRGLEGENAVLARAAPHDARGGGEGAIPGGEEADNIEGSDVSAILRKGEARSGVAKGRDAIQRRSSSFRSLRNQQTVSRIAPRCKVRKGAIAIRSIETDAEA